MDVIKSFRDAETEKIWNQQFSRRLSGIAKPGLRKLIHLDRATSLNDLAMIPGDRLEPLAGDRKNQYSIRINDQYRVCFVWRQADAYLVEIVDYH
jgi:proteic killer suppression protein